MRILVTGASGNVGKGITDLLGDKYELVLHDLNPMQTDLPFYQGESRPSKPAFVIATRNACRSPEKVVSK